MLNYYFNTNFAYFFVNKFKYYSLNHIPKNFIKIVLIINGKNINFRNLIENLLILELITMKKQNYFIYIKKPNLVLKLKTGTPIGCKLLLKKKLMFMFFKNFIFDVWPLFKKHINLNFTKTNFIFNVKNPIVFYKLSYFYIALINKNKLCFNVLLKLKNSYYEAFFLLKLLNFTKMQM